MEWFQAVAFMQQIPFETYNYIEGTQKMRRKSDFTNALDEMFSDDEKKRISAIKLLRDIATTIGPMRVRNQLIPFLSQFLDDEPPIMLALLCEIQNFSSILGGSEHDKILLPLLINFCTLDEKEVAMKSVELIESILIKHPDAYLDTVRKIGKVEMTVAKECAALLIVNGIRKVPHLEETFIEIYRTFIFSENPSVRIIAAKNLKKLAENANNKEQIVKIVQIIFNDSEDLTKLLAIEALLLLYPVNSTAVMSKLKTLVCIGTWRINIRLCEFADQLSQVLAKAHFKLLFQPSFLKMMISEDNEIRAASCSSMLGVSKNMTPQQNGSKLLPIIIKLSEDKIGFVRKQFASNVLKTFPYFAAQKIRDNLLPMIVKLLSESNLQVATEVLNDFNELSKHLKHDKFEQIVLKPLINQLSAENWRLKLNTLDVLGKIVIEKNLYTPFIVELLMKQINDKIEATRQKATEVTAEIIKNCSREWCDSDLIPEILKIKDSTSYLVRQKILFIIDETADHVSSSTLNQYKKVISFLLVDKIPNLRMYSLKVLFNRKKLSDKVFENQILKLKEDVDPQIKQIAKTIKI